MKSTVLTAIIFLCISLSAQENKPKVTVAKPTIPPTISVEMREKYFKTQAEFQVAETALKEATQAAQIKNSALQEQVAKIRAVCGDAFSPNMDKDGEVICSANLDVKK
jgi:hypothetical protein